jgi:hypothetical protein
MTIDTGFRLSSDKGGAHKPIQIPATLLLALSNPAYAKADFTYHFIANGPPGPGVREQLENLIRSESKKGGLKEQLGDRKLKFIWRIVGT